jgi:GT2 family glycosyltransferase
MYGVLGGAVFGTAAYLRTIGSLDIDSFIYYEEVEMARAAQLAGFRVAWAPRATVTNVHDTTMATNGIPSRSRVAMVRYLMARARFRFTLRRYPQFLPSVALAQFAHCSYDLARGNVREAWAAVLGAYDALRGQHRRFPGLGQAELPGRVVEPRGARSA